MSETIFFEIDKLERKLLQVLNYNLDFTPPQFDIDLFESIQ